MTGKQKAKLMDDLRTRLAIKRRLCEHSREVVAIELGISTTTVWHVEKGMAQSRPGTGITPDVAREILRRRSLCQLENERMEDYRLETLSAKHGLSVTGICGYAKAVQEENRKIMAFEVAA